MKESQRIHLKSKARYRAPKIHKVLVNNGLDFILKRLQHLMDRAKTVQLQAKKCPTERAVQLNILLK
ncbi:hypothetical protein COA18_27940 [Priestia megaterium]|nr:hypothetical protein COA18_27940 [Priestia megaterium]